jgi:hypothetical protein
MRRIIASRDAHDEVVRVCHLGVGDDFRLDCTRNQFLVGFVHGPTANRNNPANSGTNQTLSHPRRTNLNFHVRMRARYAAAVIVCCGYGCNCLDFHQ